MEVGTTFSNTVIVSAALADVCKGRDLGVAMSTMGAAHGVKIVANLLTE